MAGEYPVSGFAGGGGGTEDRTASRPAGAPDRRIFAQHSEPRCEVIGVANGRHDAERGAQKGRPDFGDQFLAGIILAAKGVGEVTPAATDGRSHDKGCHPRDFVPSGTSGPEKIDYARRSIRAEEAPEIFR